MQDKGIQARQVLSLDKNVESLNSQFVETEIRTFELQRVRTRLQGSVQSLIEL